MKKIYSILMILAAAAGLTNCSKADLVENKEAENGGTVVYATTDAVTKTTLSDDYKVLWSTGDQIKFVKNDTPATTYTFTLSEGEGTTSGAFTGDTPADGEYTVYYPAAYDGTNWPAQTYVGTTDISGALMKAAATVSGGSIPDLTFTNEGGILRYTVKGSKTIKSINVKSGSTLDVTLDCGTSGVALTEAGTVFNIALPAGEYSNATLTFTATDNTMATKTASTFKVTKNKVSLATFEATALSFLPAGALLGEFTVNAGGKQVYFSKGNLTYDVTTKNWAFYEHQYGCATGYESNLISLFTWGYDATKSIVPDGTGYVTGHTTGGDKQFSASEDWGYVFGDESSVWRTLTKEEWCYLFAWTASGTNTDTSSPRYNLHKYGVTVCDKANFLVLAPDGWDLSKNPLQSSYGTTSSEGNPMTWEQAEAAGLVCLPAAGYRGGSSVFNVGDCGLYWSSSANDGGRACSVNFVSGNVFPDDYGRRSYGYSVRLITESK